MLFSKKLFCAHHHGKLGNAEIIETITFYHQYQREVKQDPDSGEMYIETTLEDIRWANKLLRDVLLAKADELPKATREFFERLKTWLKAGGAEGFHAKEIREAFRGTYPGTP